MKKGIQVILLVLAVAGTIFFARFMKYQYDIKHIQVNPVVFSQVKDGTYHGKYDLFLVKTKVKAKMKGGILKELILEDHINGRGEVAEKIIENILHEQSMEVDMVSGATASSKAILKALEDALDEGA